MGQRSFTILIYEVLKQNMEHKTKLAVWFT